MMILNTFSDKISFPGLTATEATNQWEWKFKVFVPQLLITLRKLHQPIRVIIHIIISLDSSQ